MLQRPFEEDQLFSEAENEARRGERIFLRKQLVIGNLGTDPSKNLISNFSRL